MPSVTFDNTQIVTTTYVPVTFKHESAPDRELALSGLSRKDGDVLVTERYGSKVILVSGNIKASTQTALETAIDTFKELFSRKEKNLDIGWAGSTRRYVATCRRHDFDREFMHVGFVPWTAEFVVPNGVGQDTALTASIDAESVAVSPYSTVASFLGSAEPKPVISITVGAGLLATCLGISIENSDKDEKMIITRDAGFANTKVLEIDCNLRTVKYDSESIAFHGVFPTFDLGSNNMDIEVGRIIDQQFGVDVGTNDGGSNPNGDVWVAQSFIVPEKDTTYQGVAFYGKRVGASTGDVDIRIETDSGGKPSGTLAHVNSAVVITNGTAITTSYAWQIIEFLASFTLQPNTKYWIVMRAIYATGGSYIDWRYRSGTNATYKRGNEATTSDSGVTWVDYPDRDMLFRLYYGGIQDTVPTLTLDVDYYKKYL